MTVAETMAKVAEIPGATDFCRALQDQGFINGGKAVLYAGPIRPPNPKAVDPVILESFDDMKERSKHATAR